MLLGTMNALTDASPLNAPGAAPPSSPKPRVWTVFVAFVVAVIGVTVIGALALAALVIVRSGRLELDPDALAGDIAQTALSLDGLLLGVVVSCFVLSLVALVGARLSASPVTARLRLGPTHTRAAPLALLAFGAVALGFAVGVLLLVLNLRRDSVLGTLTDAVQSASGARIALAFALIGVAGPVAEELFFRGYMQTRLRERWGAWPAILIASAAFGLLHMDLAQGITAGALGIYMGWAVEVTGSIRPAIFAHVANNVVATSLSFLASAGENDAGEDTEALLVFAASCAAVAGGAAWFFRRSRPSDRGGEAQ